MELNINKIQLELNRQGWKKIRLAKEMGITRAAVSTFFKRKSASWKNIGKMARIFGVDEKDLLI